MTLVLLLMAVWVCTEMEKTCLEDHSFNQISCDVSLSEISRIDFTTMVSLLAKTADALMLYYSGRDFAGLVGGYGGAV